MFRAQLFPSVGHCVQLWGNLFLWVGLPCDTPGTITCLWKSVGLQGRCWRRAPGDKLPPQRAVGFRKSEPLLKEFARCSLHRITLKVGALSNIVGHDHDADTSSSGPPCYQLKMRLAPLLTAGEKPKKSDDMFYSE